MWGRCLGALPPLARCLRSGGLWCPGGVVPWGEHGPDRGPAAMTRRIGGSRCKDPEQRASERSSRLVAVAALC